MKKNHIAGLTPLALVGGLLVGTTAQADARDAAYERTVSVAGVAATTGFGADVSWRFNPYLAVTARYTDGLSFGTTIDDEDIDYDADFDMKASSLKLDVFPFKGRFFLSAGVMKPDISASVVGTPNSGSSYEINGNNYTASDIGSVVGHATVADGTQPYLGLGWRSSHETGFGFFSEFGVVATDVDVSISTTNGYENIDSGLRDDIQAEEKSLEDDIDKVSVFPVAVLGISYTF